MGKSIGFMWRMGALGSIGLLLLGIAFFSAQSTYAASRNVTYAHATLSHTPYGTADLLWSSSTKDLTVTVKLYGLAPKSVHPMHIHMGTCQSNGIVKYTLNDAVANAAGYALSATTIPDVQNGIPNKEWYVNVHNGPGLTTSAEFLPIACSEVINPSRGTSVHMHLGSTSAANQAVSGVAHLTLKNGDLKVVLTLHNLVSGTTHAAHIHAGTCQKQSPGTVVYALPYIKSDRSGNATISTTIHHVGNIPAHGWYINVHRSVNLTTQTGFDPIACGNVSLG